MATLTTTMTYSNQTVADFTNWAKPFGNAFSTFGWVNTNDIGAIQGTATYGSATITSVQINNGVLQIGFSGATNQFASGTAVLLTGLTTNTFLNNQIVRIQNILSPLNLYISAAPSAITGVANGGVGLANLAWSITSSPNNFYAGTTFNVAGFANMGNNGTFVCTASTATILQLSNPNFVVETHAATATPIAITRNTTYSLNSVATSVGTTAVYTAPAGFQSAIANLYAGATFTVTGFTNLSNNGTFVCTASTVNTFTLYNSNAVAESNTAAAVTMQPDATNSVFTAYFSHPDVAPVSDTGTATIVYGWNTVTNVPDIVANNGTASFPIGHSIRWRGNYVGITPIITNIQTTGNLTTLTFGNNGHGLDLTYTKGLGSLVDGVTNASFTWLNSVAGAQNWPIVSMTSTTVTLNTGASPRADIASTPVSAGVLSPTYAGGAQSANNAFSQVVADVVMYNGDLYIACSGSQVGGGANSITNNTLITLPGTGASGSKFWSRFAYDIWKSNDALTSTNPICFKVLYGNDNGNRPTPYFYWGCATDGSGNITTNYNWGPNQVFSPSWGGGTGGFTFQGPNTNTTDTAPWESDFSGTPGRFACIPWRGYTQGVAGPQFILNIERSHDNSGNDTDAYWTVVFVGQPSNAVGAQNLGNAWFAITQSIFKPGTGGAGPAYAMPNGNGNNSSATGAGAGNASANQCPLPTVVIPTATSLSYNNSIPVLPVFPLVGYVGNPMLGMVLMKAGDTSDGALVTASFYGTSHPYLMCTRGGCAAAGPFTPNNAVGFNSAAGIRWE